MVLLARIFHQKKHGYYKSYCFLPLHVFCGNQLLVSYLRESSKDGALHTGAILKLLVKRKENLGQKLELYSELTVVFAGN